jgi:hypothetical protein
VLVEQILEVTDGFPGQQLYCRLDELLLLLLAGHSHRRWVQPLSQVIADGSGGGSPGCVHMG